MPRVSIAPEADLATEINVLPLIDVLLVLIIVFFLIDRTHIFIPTTVPAPAAAAPGEGSPQIVLEVTESGGFAINRQPIPAEQLVTQLRSIFALRPRKVLFVRVAPNRSYQDAIRAMDVAREAGIEVLAWVPRETR